MNNIPVILLAAGSSTRMGQPKQLLPWGVKTLIEYQIQKLLETGSSVIVVLGANSEKIIPNIQSYPVRIVVNEHWQKGMGSTIICGINELIKNNPTAVGVLISLVDQPLISLVHYKKMLSLFKEGEQQIIASKSPSGWLGVPAIFDRYYFDSLKNLNGEKGAREIIRDNKDSVISLICDELADDIDTVESYHKVLKKYENLP